MDEKEQVRNAVPGSGQSWKESTQTLVRRLVITFPGTQNERLGS